MNYRLFALASLGLGSIVVGCASAPDTSARSSTPVAVGVGGVDHADDGGDGVDILRSSDNREVGRVTRNGATTTVVLDGATFTWDASTFDARRGDASLHGARTKTGWVARPGDDTSAFESQLQTLVAIAPALQLELPGARGSSALETQDFGERCVESTGYNLYGCDGACSSACSRPNGPVSCDGSQGESCSASWFWYTCTVKKCFQRAMEEEAL